MKEASHTKQSSTRSLRIVPEVGLVDLFDPELGERLAGKVSGQLELFAARMREGLLAASVAIGLEVMGEFVDAEVAEVAGAKGKHDPNRVAYRHGTEDGKVTLGGRRVPVCRPRVRGVEGVEVHLESYDTFASVDLLSDHMVASMLAGLSGRRYESALEPVGEEVEASSSGTSQSSVSRRFVAATGERLAEFRTRDLSEQRWLICFVDGFDFASHTMVGALGVTADGTKVPLGVVEGSTENATVVRGLIAGLRDRGLDASEGILFVLDGAKALARQLDKVNPDAAGSLREGLDDTLTVTRLGVTGALLKTVMSTNPVESMIEIVRAHARNVKRWQPGDMRLRWAAAGMLAASTQFRRVKGYHQLPTLAHALRHTVSAHTDQSPVAVTA